MPPPDRERLGALVPGSGEVEVQRLSAGLDSETYRVRRTGRLYALKVSHAAPAPAKLKFELAVLRSAAARGLAPRLVAFEPDGRMRLLEWLEGTACSEAAAGRPDQRLAELLKAVHALPLPDERRVMSARDWTAHYDAALTSASAPRLSEFSGQAELKLRRLESQGAQEPCICHSDLHRLNVLVRGPGPGAGSLALLDWEYAHVSEALWDLAGWSANNDLDAKAQHALLTAYNGRAPNPHELERLGLLYWLYDYICLQWMRLYVIRQGPAAPPFAARTACLEGRLRAPSMAQSPSRRIADL